MLLYDLSKFLKNSQLIIHALAILFLLPSCISSAEDNNKKFTELYGKQVERINRQREELAYPKSKEAKKKDPEYNKWRDPGYVLGVEGTVGLQNAYVDTSKLKLPKPPEEFTPNMQTFTEGKNNTRVIPDDVFMVSYTSENYPDSYKKPGVNFDNIIIPAHDAFGIETDLGEKDYTQVGQIGLQRNIDYIRTHFSSEDKEVLRIFVKEQKEAKYKKRLKQKQKEEAKIDDENVNDEDINDDVNQNTNKTTKDTKQSTNTNQENINQSGSNKKAAPDQTS